MKPTRIRIFRKGSNKVLGEMYAPGFPTQEEIAKYSLDVINPWVDKIKKENSIPDSEVQVVFGGQSSQRYGTT